MLDLPCLEEEAVTVGDDGSTSTLRDDGGPDYVARGKELERARATVPNLGFHLSGLLTI